jgi:tetratricopeptide (TPR) repeat protein
MNRLKLAGLGVVVLLAVLGAYANHFQNTFHFDDAHTVEENPFIRDLRNIPRFFRDATTFSSLPTNQSYRPLITTTLAIDYHLANGLNPAWFHIDTFIWYVLQLAAMFFLFLHLMEAAAPSPNNGYVAMFAVSLYGLHPVCAESVNYIVQRGEIHSTLGVVLGFVMYIYWPKCRPWAGYLIPVIVGALSKPPALMFLPILFVYVYLFESEDTPGTPLLGNLIKRGLQATRASIPSFIVFVAMSALQWAMTPKDYTTGGTSHYLYWLTQPGVILHYMKQFFLPTDLSADTDRTLVTGIFSETFVLSAVMFGLLVTLIWPLLRRADMRPFTFGLWWFAFTLAPTSLPALAEVDNDHRMFLPFVGFTLAVVWGIWQIRAVQRRPEWAVIPAILVLGACAWGTHQRNIVWHSEDSLWKDVTEKSPRNGRGLMNYGLTLMGKGDFNGALDLFQRAEFYTPDYAILKLNLGIDQAALGNDKEAEAKFHEALELSPENAQCYYFYARYLKEKNRFPEAMALLRQAITMNASYAEPRYLLMEIYSDQGDAINLRALALETQQVFPGDPTAAQFLASGPHPTGQPAAAPMPTPAEPKTPEDFLTMSLNYELAGKHDECIAAANQALKLRPGYAEAYNNIAAAQQSMGHWDEAIKASTEAIRLKPDFQLAKNNLAWELSQKQLQKGK